MDGALSEGALRPLLPAARLSLSGRRWFRREGGPRAASLAARGLSPLLAAVLAGRGVTEDAVEGVLTPQLRTLLPDPDRLADMARAVARLARAVEERETVGILTDYDVDGACAGALLADLLEALGARVVTDVPDRHREGYGPNAAAMERLLGAGARLIVTLDCGTAAGAVFAPLAGKTDIIVFDHHKHEGALPPVLATVNPNRPDDGSGQGHLCATGVTFLAAVGLLRALRERGFFAARPEPDLRADLDLVALATVADVVPLIGLNRAFVAQGLKVLAQRRRVGLAALIDAARISRLDMHALGFALGPRINAGSRIGRSDLGLSLLRCRDPDAAAGIARHLDQLNRERQDIEEGLLEAAMAEAERQQRAGRAVLLVAEPGWHVGVVGIVASRLKERFNRPACVGAHVEGMIKGSGRSLPGFDLGAAVIAAREAGVAAGGGGHAMAAGFTLAPDRLEAFHDFLHARLAGAEALPPVPDLILDAEVPAETLDLALAESIAALAPFGQGFEEPLFLIPRLVLGGITPLGAKGATWRLDFTAADGRRLEGVLFRAPQSGLAAELPALRGALLHVAGFLRPNEWNGTRRLQLQVVDAALA